MEHVVAIIVSDPNRGEIGILAWGRIHDKVDATPLLQAMARITQDMGFSAGAKIRLCETLGEAQSFQYFFEGLLVFSARLASEPILDRVWQESQLDDLAFRKSLYLIGQRNVAESNGKSD